MCTLGEDSGIWQSGSSRTGALISAAGAASARPSPRTIRRTGGQAPYRRGLHRAGALGIAHRRADGLPGWRGRTSPGLASPRTPARFGNHNRPPSFASATDVLRAYCASSAASARQPGISRARQDVRLLVVLHTGSLPGSTRPRGRRPPRDMRRATCHQRQAKQGRCHRVRLLVGRVPGGGPWRSRAIFRAPYANPAPTITWYDCWRGGNA